LAFPVAALLLATNIIDPVVALLHEAQVAIFGVIHNYGWTMILLAAIIKLCFWPLNTMQFKAMLKTQQIAPKLKALQARYKNDKEKLNTETMALYKETGANPLAGCLPLLLQMPILISMYWSVMIHKDTFTHQGWLWIGSAAAAGAPYHILAGNLAAPDYVLLAFYVVSMYFQVRFTSPAVDPAQAQQQKIMAFISPVMVGYLGFKYAWPSALILYWLSFNVFTMAQQLYLIRKYHTNPSPIGPHPEAALATTGASVANGKSGAAPGVSLAAPVPVGTGGGSRAARKRRNSRR
jgi:YidC/Oxa1 family membrane protein insertase